MSSIIIGILLLLSLVGLIYYAVKGKNLMMGFLIITTVWLVFRLNDILNNRGVSFLFMTADDRPLQKPVL